MAVSLNWLVVLGRLFGFSGPDLAVERERFQDLREQFRVNDPLVLEGGQLSVTAARLREINDLLEQDLRAI